MQDSRWHSSYNRRWDTSKKSNLPGAFPGFKREKPLETFSSTTTRRNAPKQLQASPLPGEWSARTRPRLQPAHKKSDPDENDLDELMERISKRVSRDVATRSSQVTDLKPVASPPRYVPRFGSKPTVSRSVGVLKPREPLASRIKAPTVFENDRYSTPQGKGVQDEFFTPTQSSSQYHTPDEVKQSNSNYSTPQPPPSTYGTPMQKPKSSYHTPSDPKPRIRSEVSAKPSPKVFGTPAKTPSKLRYEIRPSPSPNTSKSSLQSPNASFMTRLRNQRKQEESMEQSRHVTFRSLVSEHTISYVSEEGQPKESALSKYQAWKNDEVLDESSDEEIWPASHLVREEIKGKVVQNKASAPSEPPKESYAQELLRKLQTMRLEREEAAREVDRQLSLKKGIQSILDESSPEPASPTPKANRRETRTWSPQVQEESDEDIWDKPPAMIFSQAMDDDWEEDDYVEEWQDGNVLDQDFKPAEDLSILDSDDGLSIHSDHSILGELADGGLEPIDSCAPTPTTRRVDKTPSLTTGRIKSLIKNRPMVAASVAQHHGVLVNKSGMDPIILPSPGDFFGARSGNLGSLEGALSPSKRPQFFEEMEERRARLDKARFRLTSSVTVTEKSNGIEKPLEKSIVDKTASKKPVAELTFTERVMQMKARIVELQKQKDTPKK